MPKIESKAYNILINEDYAILKSFIEQFKASSVFILADSNTKRDCLPILEEKLKISFSCIQIAPGEQFKNLKTCTQIWNALIQNGCDRHSLIINLGGGVIGDMGGFIASTYMRGIKFINIPTSLLAQVDASVGGKLGIDFLEFKNMIGVFNNPELVWIDTQFLQTLPLEHLRSGYAEVIKHALIASEEHWFLLSKDYFDWEEKNWQDIITRSINIKNRIVSEDPYENGLRKILNFGHTIGHAIEGQYLNTEKPILHGNCVAAGMICESYLSNQKLMLSNSDLRKITSYLIEIFPEKIELLSHGKELIERMISDKKNYKGNIMISTLSSIGDCLYNQKFDKDDILKSFEYYENCFD